ncbi:MAG: ACP S-malonyltransferase [Pseudobdellovibrionaceae bacterium]|nr:MAG: ACP S-malonyltransferase [Pseudobdellovibrionaceae bacterium]
MWAALFPGQGSQHVGMGKFLFENFTTARLRFEEASDILGTDFKRLCFEGPESDLALTENTQPALLLVSTCAFQCFSEETSFQPLAAAGHSVGEYAAVVAGESLRFSDAIKAVKTRGQSMQQAVPVGEGGMAAVMGLDEAQVRHMCLWAEEQSGFTPLEPANFNAPGQIVISGNQKAIDWLKENLTKDIFKPAPSKVRIIPLKVSAPFHCSMMKPAREIMHNVLHNLEFSRSQFPIVQNVDAQNYSSGNSLRQHLIEQVDSPVRWIQCVEKLRDLGATQVIEFGSGQVLSGLVKKIDSEHLATFNMNALDEFKAVVSAYNQDNA